MFCFCCPKRNKTKEKNTIDEKLIQVNDSSPRRTIPSSKRLVMSQSDKKKQSVSGLTQQSMPISHAQPTTTNNQQGHMRHPHFLSDGHTLNIGVPPYFQQQPLFNSKHIQSPLTKSKGELYQLDHNTEIVYFDTKKQDQFCIRYLINKKPNIQRESKSVLNYVLSRKSHNYQHNNNNNNEQTEQLVLVIPSKVLYQTKHLQIPQHIHAIFTNMRRLQKNPSVNNSTQIIQIIQGDCGFIKTQAFDKIIVILEGQQDVEFIKKYCFQLCKRYSLEEFIKIWWVLPAYVGIEDISDIIKNTLRKFLITERIEQAAKYMYYEIDLIKDLNLQPFLLVKNKHWRQSIKGISNNNKNKNNIKNSLKQSTTSSINMNKIQKSQLTKDYQTQICLGIGLLMVEMNQNVMPFYKYFLENVLNEMKLIDYMKYKSLLQNEKENFFKKLLFYNLLLQQGCKTLQQNNKIIEHKYANSEHRRFTIKHSVKKKFIAAFGFQDSIQTGENNTPVQQQWDDQLRLEDLQTRKGSWDKQSGGSDDNDLNLIDQEEIEKIVIEELMFGDGGDQLNADFDNDNTNNNNNINRNNNTNSNNNKSQQQSIHDNNNNNKNEKQLEQQIQTQTSKNNNIDSKRHKQKHKSSKQSKLEDGGQMEIQIIQTAKQQVLSL